MYPESCVLVPATWYDLRRKYPNDSPCEHCLYHKYGCPDVEAFIIGVHKFAPIEQSSAELPKCGIWCRKCKDTSGRIFHKTFWNGRTAFAVRCRQCGEEFLLYESEVREQYTGFVNGNGDFVSAVSYGERHLKEYSEFARKLASNRNSTEDRVVYSTESEDIQHVTAMELAMKKAGLI